MTNWGWQLCHFPVELTNPTVTPSVADGWEDWLEGTGIPVRTPFLLSPTFEFDVVLNSFFLAEEMIGQAWNTRKATPGT